MYVSGKDIFLSNPRQTLGRLIAQDFAAWWLLAADAAYKEKIQHFSL